MSTEAATHRFFSARLLSLSSPGSPRPHAFSYDSDASSYDSDASSDDSDAATYDSDASLDPLSAMYNPKSPVYELYRHATPHWDDQKEQRSYAKHCRRWDAFQYPRYHFLLVDLALAVAVALQN